MKTATEIINEKMSKGQLVFVSINKTNAEGKTFSQIEDEKFDKLSEDLYRVEKIGKFFIEGYSSTSDQPSTIVLAPNDVSTIILPADVEEFDDELCEVIQL